MTEWRPVPIAGFQAFYEVSDDGRVRSIRQGFRFQRAIAITLWGHDYRRVTLTVLDPAAPKGRRSQAFAVHTLVAGAFIGQRPLGHETNHKSGDKSDNSVANLEYVMPTENEAHAVRLGLKARGERNACAKLTVSDIIAIRNDKRGGTPIGRDYGIDRHTVNVIKRGASWKHI